jgi:hypothetical protein
MMLNRRRRKKNGQKGRKKNMEETERDREGGKYQKHKRQ